MLERKRCAQCGKDEAHAYCTLCHHYFHDVPKVLPEGEEKLIDFPTGKRMCEGGPVYGLGLVENMCVHVWQASGRAKVWGESRGPVVGIDGVVVRKKKTVSSLGNAGNGATESDDVSPASPPSLSGVTLPSGSAMGGSSSSDAVEDTVGDSRGDRGGDQGGNHA